ncbi:BA14K family protein [Bradyrhizobium sp. HKCCYLS20291]|uniref:BA14K family protein n=1 Tax=Bradyrhizobium sp. HKCCYLS20291 TaxID=3420766 RepID=UPI003EC093C6
MQLRKLLTVAAIGTMTLSAATPLAAAPLLPNHPASTSTGPAAGVEQVQYRHWRGGHDWHPGLGRRHGYQYGYRHHHNGAGAAALGGLAAGAIIGGAIANSRAQASESEVYCAQRYRSFDPASGTYLGRDGRRHSCP